MDWLAKFRFTLEKGQLLRGVDRFLVGMSGGPDSTALFLLFTELRQALGAREFPELLAGHVHHGLRGAEADNDEQFVRGLAAARGVEYLVFRGNAAGEAMRSGGSPEEAARALRYRALRSWALEKRLDAVALAHHMEDQAETVLYRIARGTGLGGLQGIPIERPLFRKGPSTRLVRPLLSWHRDELLQYLSERGQPYCLDTSNQDRSIPRNLVRHEVLPLLEKMVHPGAVRSLARLGDIAQGVARDLRTLGEQAFREALVEEPGASALLALEPLRKWPPSVVYEALKAAMESVVSRGALPRNIEGWSRPRRKGPQDPLEKSHGLSARAFQPVLAWLREGGPRESCLSLGSVGGGLASLFLELRYGQIRIGVGGPPRSSPAAAAPFSGSPPTASWLDWKFDFEERLVPPPFDPRGEMERRGGEGGRFEECLDGARIEAAGPLKVRSRRPGDWLWPLDAPGRKKLKEFFRERRVWPLERDAVPLVVAGESIVWVVGHRIDHRFRVTPETRRVVVLGATLARNP